MAGRITELDPAAALDGSELVEVVQGGDNVQTTTQDIADLATGAGDVEGPASAVDSRIAAFDGTSGKLLKDGGQTIAQVIAAAGGTVIGTTAHGSEPGSPATGDVDLYSDGHSLARYSGSIWAPWGPIFPLKKTPLVSAFTWVNQDSAVATDGQGGIFMVDGSPNSQLHLLTKSVSAPYTVIAAILPFTLSTASLSLVGIAYRQSSDDKLIAFGMGSTAIGAGSYIEVRKWTDPSTASTVMYSANLPLGGPLWVRIQDNNTNRLIDVSPDGQNWVNIYTETRTTFMTANHVGPFVYGQNANSRPAMKVISYE